VTIDEEVLAGGQYRVGHKRIEPLHLQDPKISSTKTTRVSKGISNTSTNNRSTGARGRFHGLRKIGASKPNRSARSGWQPERKSAVNRIAFRDNMMLIDDVEVNNNHKKKTDGELTKRSGSHIWKLACSDRLLSNSAGEHFTPQRARRNNMT
jgi:hypothetical protein